MAYLQIAVKYLPLVQLLHGQQYLSKAELGLGLGQLHEGEMVEELAAWVKFQQEVEVVVALEGGFELRDEGKVDDQLG